MLRVEICQMTDFSKRSREFPLFQEPLSFSDEGMKVTMKWEFSSLADCLLALLRLKELRKLLRIVSLSPAYVEDFTQTIPRLVISFAQ